MKYFIHLPMKMGLIDGSETSAIRTQTPGNYPKENITQDLIIFKNMYINNFINLRSLSLTVKFQIIILLIVAY